MSIFLTGATGFIGTAILRQLHAQGRGVTALVRNPDKASSVEALGATVVIGDITDTRLLEEQAKASDGVIHVASPGDASSASVDDALVTAVFSGLEGSGKPYIHTGGVWVLGNGADLTERSAQHPPALTAWRADVEKRVLTAEGVKTTLIMPQKKAPRAAMVGSPISQSLTVRKSFSSIKTPRDYFTPIFFNWLTISFSLINPT